MSAPKFYSLTCMVSFLKFITQTKPVFLPKKKDHDIITTPFSNDKISGSNTVYSLSSFSNTLSFNFFNIATNRRQFLIQIK